MTSCHNLKVSVYHKQLHYHLGDWSSCEVSLRSTKSSAYSYSPRNQKNSVITWSTNLTRNAETGKAERTPISLIKFGKKNKHRPGFFLPTCVWENERNFLVKSLSETQCHRIVLLSESNPLVRSRKIVFLGLPKLHICAFHLMYRTSVTNDTLTVVKTGSIFTLIVIASTPYDEVRRSKTLRSVIPMHPQCNYRKMIYHLCCTSIHAVRMIKSHREPSILG